MTQSYPIELQNFGLSTLAELFDDLVIYRHLEPLDRHLSGLKSVYYQIGLSDQRIPRKLESDYAKVALWLLQEAQKQYHSSSLQEILFIGDTLSGDGQAFRNICTLGGLPGTAFIGAEAASEAEEVEVDEETNIYQANRWSSLSQWLAWSLDSGLKLGEGTAVVVDMDKTALGARGRNDKAIDVARLDGLYRTVDSVLGEDFDRELFVKNYNGLNQPKYHGLTEDNQDYLAYICLILNTGLITCDELIKEMQESNLNSFRQFIRWVETKMLGEYRVSENVRQAHEAMITSVRAGDPTPFKRFRREEFATTLEHMNNLPDETPPAQRLETEITITQEVREASLWLKDRGCLILSLSDKPDEASCPHKTIHRGKPPIHRAQTHCVGVSIQKELDKLD